MEYTCLSSLKKNDSCHVLLSFLNLKVSGKDSGLCATCYRVTTTASSFLTSDAFFLFSICWVRLCLSGHFYMIFLAFSQVCLHELLQNYDCFCFICKELCVY